VKQKEIIVSTPQPQPTQPPALAVDTLLAEEALLEAEISDEEANEEIEIPDDAPETTTAPDEAGDVTPSVRSAVNKAADVLRELRGGQ
jgi:hypothetical protein